MPGTILSSSSRKRIVRSLYRLAAYATDRGMLIELYKLARLSLVGGKEFDEVVQALGERATELGVNLKGGNKNA